MINQVLFASAILVLILAYLLAREMRLRRALQMLLTKILKHWRDSHQKIIKACVRTGVLIVALSVLSGCGANDSQDVKDIATQAMDEQAAQNNRIADATRDLVSADSRAREELVAAHAQLQQQLQAERANIDLQKSQLNDMRQNIERDRRRAPVIAEAIDMTGGILVCLCPLLLAAYVLYSVNRASAADEEQIVNQILIGELTSETPRLLPPAMGLALTDQHSTEPVDSAVPAETEPSF